MPLIEKTYRTYRKSKVLQGIMLFLVYGGLTYGTFFFFTPATVLHPAVGVGLAGLVLGGLILWPAIFLGAAIAYIFGVESPLESPLLPAFLFATLYTLAGVLGAYLLRHINFQRKLNKVQDVLSLIIVVSLISIIIPAAEILGSSIFVHVMTSTFQERWIGLMASMLIITPFILRWTDKPHRRSKRALLEAFASLATISVVSLMFFFPTIVNITPLMSLYILFLPLLWIALRIGPRIMTLSLFIIGTTAVFGGFWNIVSDIDTGIFPQLNNYFAQTSLVISFISLVFLILVSIEEERKEVNKKLYAHVTDLEHGLEETRKRERERIEFIGILAHELRNPLSPVINSLELLSLKGLDHKNAKKWIEIINTHAQLMSKLLDDLLDVTRISRKRMLLEKEPIVLQGVIERAVDTFRLFIENKNQKLIINLPKEPIIVDADIIRLTQVFSNVLLNASKYTPPKGTITITCKKKEHIVLVSIKDTGIGISPEMREKIFQPFSSIGQSQSRVGTGLGLGLSLSKQLIKMHKGEIYVKSDGVDKGSEFIIKLLLAKPSKQQEVNKHTEQHEPETLKPTKSHVLIVDDNEAAGAAIAELLEHNGYTTSHATNGKDGIEQALATTFDVILLDIGLPDINGYEVAHILHQKLDRVPLLIALTGYGQEEDKLESKTAGIRHHLTKPVNIKEVITAIESSADQTK